MKGICGLESLIPAEQLDIPTRMRLPVDEPVTGFEANRYDAECRGGATHTCPTCAIAVAARISGMDRVA
jgi:hypothetical protein